MAALMFSVPEETARILHELDIPDGVLEHNAHITVLYLGDDVPIEKIAEVLPVLHKVTSQTVPFSVSSHSISTFSAGDEGVPVIALVESAELHAFRQDLCSAFDAAGIGYSKKHPRYVPHVTLTYASDPELEFAQDFPALTWPCHELLLWGSNRGAGRLVVKFPLSLPMARVSGAKALQQRQAAKRTAFSAFRKAMVQLAMWSDQGHEFV